MLEGYERRPNRQAAPWRDLPDKIQGSLRGDMTESAAPFTVPKNLEPALARLQAYWQGLRRGEGKIPFADDLDLPALSDLAGQLLLLDVFAKPERYRLSIVGKQIGERYGKEIAGQFADEIAPHNPLDYLRSQSSATIERGAPTYYRHGAAAGLGVSASPGYARLLLPMWGEGHIAALLGAIVWI